MNQYFEKMMAIVNCRESNQISLRIYFMLQDLIELRANKWSVPWRDNEAINLSAITKVEKEALRKHE